MASRGISWQGILLRFIFAIMLVFLTYNPSGYSYFHWLQNPQSGYLPLLIFAGIVLLIIWVIFLRATLRSLGVIGLVLAFAFFGGFFWIMIDWNLIPADSAQAIQYVVLVILSGVLAIGVSWSLIRRRISGQVDVDEIENN